MVPRHSSGTVANVALQEIHPQIRGMV